MSALCSRKHLIWNRFMVYLSLEVRAIKTLVRVSPQGICISIFYFPYESNCHITWINDSKVNSQKEEDHRANIKYFMSLFVLLENRAQTSCQIGQRFVQNSWRK